MNFEGQHGLVLAGKKGEHWYPAQEGAPPWIIGRSYAVQDRAGAAALGYIKVLATTTMLLGEVTASAVKRGGHESPEAFQEWWRERHGSWEPEAKVWAVVFALDLDRFRLLAADSSYGYTHDPRMAMKDEPEAVDKEEQERLTREAQSGYANRRAASRARIAQLRAEARAQIEKGKDPNPALDKALADLRRE